MSILNCMYLCICIFSSCLRCGICWDGCFICSWTNKTWLTMVWTSENQLGRTLARPKRYSSHTYTHCSFGNDEAIWFHLGVVFILPHTQCTHKHTHFLPGWFLHSSLGPFSFFPSVMALSACRQLFFYCEISQTLLVSECYRNGKWKASLKENESRNSLQVEVSQYL